MPNCEQNALGTIYVAAVGDFIADPPLDGNYKAVRILLYPCLLVPRTHVPISQELP